VLAFHSKISAAERRSLSGFFFKFFARVCTKISSNKLLGKGSGDQSFALRLQHWNRKAFID